MTVIFGDFSGGACPAAAHKREGGAAAWIGPLDLEQTHRDLTALIAAAADAEEEGFAEAFRELAEFAALRFAEEAALMCALRDPMGAAHRRHHDWLLRMLATLRAKVAEGRLQVARAFIRERLPKWLLIHAATMDARLAAHLMVGRNA